MGIQSRIKRFLFSITASVALLAIAIMPCVCSAFACPGIDDESHQSEVPPCHSQNEDTDSHENRSDSNHNCDCLCKISKVVVASEYNLLQESLPSLENFIPTLGILVSSQSVEESLTQARPLWDPGENFIRWQSVTTILAFYQRWLI